MDAVNTDDFFQATGIDSSVLTPEEKKQIAVDFLGFFLARIVEEQPEMETKLPQYFEEFGKIYKDKIK